MFQKWLGLPKGQLMKKLQVPEQILYVCYNMFDGTEKMNVIHIPSTLFVFHHNHVIKLVN